MTDQPADAEAARVLAFVERIEQVFRCKVRSEDITVRVMGDRGSKQQSEEDVTDLFDYARRNPYNGEAPSQQHSKTSREAAAAIQPKIGRLHIMILRELAKGPATDEQLCDRLNMRANTERPRRRELQLIGRVVDTGKEAVCQSGKNAVLWGLA
jgi:hypothetical protein